MTTQPVFSSSSSFSYDVFLSFRGEDTRTNFTDHLHEALFLKGIQTFIDRELVRGEEISPALVRAIEESRISVIVFSENYASSGWCLDELVKILQCKESKKQIVLPIFYKVDPSDVRKQTNSFGDAFKGLIQSKFKDDKEKVLIWKEALTKAANLSGHPLKDGEYEATFINNIVDGILSKLPPTYLYVAKYPVGIQSHVQDVEMLLDVGGNGRRMVGIWGTSGIGKTTIAKAIFNAVSHKFGGSCFLENVGEGSLVQLQKTLLREILGGQKLEIASADKGISIIHKLLRHKKILLVLDDVDQLEQLEKLAGDDWFGEGSRVIITTKNRRLLENREIELIYEVEELDYYQALELFSWHAFQRSEPPKDYLELAQRAIAFADGLPLALAILGSHLRGIDIRRWQVILDDYEGEPYTHIERILQKSYDALDDRAKDYFLDIACFFKGKRKDTVLQIVPQKFIEEFVDKALITIKWDDRILMHDLLANLGKDIVHKESPNDPGRRSRLWFYEDVKQVLTDCTGTRNIKGIMVKLPEPTEITLNPECFRNMVNLQIFINLNASLCGHINDLPNTLRWIKWDRCQLQSLPPNFQGNRLVVFNMPHSHIQSLPPNFQGNRLVKFKMPDSHIRQLEGFKHWPNLSSMDLSGCEFLEKIPDLSGIPNIEDLDLYGCESLVEVDDSVGFLDKLVHLNLGGCVNLTRFATRLRLKSLEMLSLSGCKKLESFPEIEVEMESLEILYISESGVRELPSSIAYLTGLQQFDLHGCFNLTRFATLGLKSLDQLNLRDCKRLESLPEIEVEMKLRHLDMTGSGVRELPSSVAYLTGLSYFCAANCENLTITVNSQVSSSNPELQLLPDLTDFDLSGCNLSKIDFLQRLDCWSTLRRLDLSGNNFVNLPIYFSKFVKLNSLNLSDCKNLLEIPEQVFPPVLTSVSLDNCTSLEKFPKMAWVLLDNCTSLEKIPKISRQELKLSLANCVRLRRDDIIENIFRNQVSSRPHHIFKILLSDEDFPKWFSCRKVFENYYSDAFRQLYYSSYCEFKFEIPPHLKWETSSLVLCAVNLFESFIGATILVDGVQCLYRQLYGQDKWRPSNVELTCIPLLTLHGLLEKPPTWLKQSHMCQVQFAWCAEVPMPVKMACGVHLLGHQVADVIETDDVDHGPMQRLPDAMAVDDDIHGDQHQDSELLSLSLASKTTLGKRPHFMALDNGPADHPKRRHINPDEEPKQ